MDRRHFLLTSLGGALAAPLGAQAQQARKVYRIGFLSGSSATAAGRFVEQLQQGLRDLGYVEGQNIMIEYRWAEGRQNRLSDLAAELVRTGPDLIVAATAPPAMVLKKATGTIPVVMINVGDPMSLGLATSLSRPGGNFTGLTSYSPDLAAKQLDLLKEAVPSVKSVAALTNPDNPLTSKWQNEVVQAGRSLAIQIMILKITGLNDVAGAFRDAMRQQVGAVLVGSDQVVNLLSAQISTAALDNRLPTMFANRQLMDAGGLMAYSIDFTVPYRRAATYIDKILKGARPSDLPIEEPTKFELVINMKTAKALGLTIPPSLLARADQVIE